MTPPRVADNLEMVLDRFEEAWERGPPPVLDEFLPATINAALRLQLIRELIALDLDHRWRPAAGMPMAMPPRLRVEQYVARYPEVQRAEHILVELVGEEYRARRRWGERPDRKEYATRFPAQRVQVCQKLSQVDAELAAEFAREGRLNVTDNNTTRPDSVPTVPALLEVLGQSGLLCPSKVSELKQVHFAEAKALGSELLRRGWLTPFQVNQLLQGSGRELVLGPYVLLERLGAGGAGQVFKARHERMNRLVAVKVIRRELLADPEMVGRFSREIHLVSQLSHPNVVRALDAGPIGAAHVLIMEYVEGTNLADLVKRTGPLPLAQACDFIRQAALGLQHAHERRLVHRDIKPPNLLLSAKDQAARTGPRLAPFGIVKVLDFGLGRLHGGRSTEIASSAEAAEATSMLTAPGAVMMMGTLDFMAPEQALDFHNADIRADIYSLGCTLHYLLTGGPPFPGGSVPQKLVRHQQAPIPVLSQLPPELNAALARMLAKRPEDRYQTPGEAAEALAAIQAKSGQPRWRRSQRLAALAAALLIGLIGLFFGLRHSSGIRPVTGTAPATRSPLDALQPDLIRTPQRFKGQPQELVAVLGEPVPSYDGIVAVTFVPDASMLVYVDIPGNLWLWKVGQAQPELHAKHAGILARGMNSAAFSRDARLLVIGLPEAVSLWSIAGKPTELSQRKLPTRVAAMAFAPDGKFLVSGDDKRNLTFWDLSKDQLGQLEALNTPECYVQTLAFTPDGKVLAFAGTFGSELGLVEVADRKKVARLIGHPIPGPDNIPRVWGLAFAPDGKILASAGVDKAVRLWNVETGRELHALEEHKQQVRRVAFARNGRTLVSGDEEGRVILWDTSSWTKQHDWRLPAGQIRGLAVAADGRHLAVATGTGIVYIFRLAA